ncbi:translation initiation factor IF-2 N-terminal domain-containing protein, partial [Slackia exigua]
MPNKRVHELAKEFGMDSKELLARIQEMKIPAKSHASMLAEPYVDKIRKALAPEIGAKAAGLDKEAAEAIEAEQEAENRRKEAEEAERRKAVEHERALRDAERARRGSNAAAPSTVTS